MQTNANSDYPYRSERGQSEPVGTCEKQVERSFSLSIRYVAKLARACPISDLYGIITV